MSVFVDTSALLAILDADDADHAAAAAAWHDLLGEDAELSTTNYVLVETHALVQSRLGLEAVQILDRDVAPLLRVIWVDRESHRAGVSAVLSAGRRRLSLVDCVSFHVMSQAGLTRAFSLDRHFGERGFDVLPHRAVE